MAASRLLGAAAVRVILLSFAVGHRRSYRSGSIKVATGCDSDLSADFLNFGADDFPRKIPLKSASKSSFLALAPRSGFGAAISDAVAHSSFVFCNSVSTDRTVMAASRLLCTAAACVILLSFCSWTS